MIHKWLRGINFWPVEDRDGCIFGRGCNFPLCWIFDICPEQMCFQFSPLCWFPLSWWYQRSNLSGEWAVRETSWPGFIHLECHSAFSCAALTLLGMRPWGALHPLLLSTSKDRGWKAPRPLAAKSTTADYQWLASERFWVTQVFQTCGWSIVVWPKAVD